jgi:hypothetical protein
MNIDYLARPNEEQTTAPTELQTIKDVIAESKATRNKVDLIIKEIAWWSS